MHDRPTGTVTFLFTDVVGSTSTWERTPGIMATMLARHDELSRAAFAEQHGFVFATAGDSFAVAFDAADAAVSAAVALQAALADEPWPSGATLHVRMGLNSGVAVERGDDYFGPPVNLAARVMGLAPGGEILLGEATARLLRNWRLQDQGEHRLKGIDAPERVFSVVLDGRPAERLALSGGGASNLPVARGDVLGREDALADLFRLADERRMVTLVGPGGVGKTRLSLAVAELLRPRFDEGVWFADLRLAGPERSVVAVVANALGLRSDGIVDPAVQITQFIADRRLLLVLDNCEHVLDDAASLADRMLAMGGDLVVLATSREPLEVRGEVVYPLNPLPCDGPRSAAVRLFLERANAVGGLPTAAHDESYAEVVALCERLDGLPLAIELAAARTRSLAPAELLARIGERFELLGGSRRGRQRGEQGLREVIEWSYRLLDDEEQHFFNALSVFAGSFDLRAAAAVGDLDATSVVDLVDSLVAKSLVTALPAPGGQTRYRLLETIRAFAAERLAGSGDTEASEERHSAHYMAFLTAADPETFNTLAERDRQRPELTELLAAANRLALTDPAAAVEVLRHLSYDLLVEEGLCLETTTLLGRLELSDLRSRSRALAAQSVHGVFAGAYDIAFRAGRAIEALHAEGDPDALAEATLFRVNLTAAARPAEARAMLESDVVASLLPRCGPRRSFIAETAEFIGASVEIGDRNYRRALDILEHVQAVRRSDGWVATINDAQRGFLMHLLGRNDYRPLALPKSTYSAFPAIAAALAGAYDDPDTARHRLARVAFEANDGRIPLQEAHLVACFARCAWLAGDAAHAAELLPFAAARIPSDTALILETKAALEGWTDEAFTANAYTVMADPARRIQALEHAPRLLAAEIDRWIGSAEP